MRLMLLDATFTPTAVHRSLCDATEALRLADQCLDEMLAGFANAAPEDVDEHLPDQNELFAMRASCQLFAALLQDQFGDVVPSVPGKVYTTIRTFENRWPSLPAMEKSAIALEFARQQLHGARTAFETAGETGRDLYAVVAVAFHVMTSAAGFFAVNVATWPAQVLDAIVAGGPLPEMATAAEVEMARHATRALRAAE